MRKKTILLADNNRYFLDERREFLEQAGYNAVTADNPLDAERIMGQGRIDLAVLDIRLIEDSDEGDTSGLELARKYGKYIPIIMLTGYPTWEYVKAALGKDLDGLSPAVDFLAKQEGPNLMIQAVNLTIDQPNLKKNILHEFQADSSQALHEALENKGTAETSDKFAISLERTEQDLLQHRKEISYQSERYQKIAIWVGIIGLIVIGVGAFMVYLERIPLATLSGTAGVIFECISIFFINRAIQASKQVDDNYNQLLEIYKASHLISICDTIKKKSKREDTKILIIENLTGKWFSR